MDFVERYTCVGGDVYTTVNGNFVLFRDYSNIEMENNAMREALRQIKNWDEDCDCGDCQACIARITLEELKRGRY